MSDLSFDVVGWISAASGSDDEQATMGSLRILAGEGLRIPITEVEDTIAQTVRSHIHVPLAPVAMWLLSNWWRLRWEGRGAKPSSDWHRAHSLSGIGGDNAWPALEIFSDGESIQLHMAAEIAPDVSAIRYLRSVAVEVPAERFEAAVERFVDVVEARLGAVLPAYRAITELRAELSEERGFSATSRSCRLQALAGIDPGDAPEEWIRVAESLAEEAGPRAGDEILRALPDLENNPHSAANIVDAMKRSSTAIDLTWAVPTTLPVGRELPWQTGARLAREVRRRQKLGSGPIDNGALSDLLSVALPFTERPLKSASFNGGFRNGVTGGRTRILWPSARTESQRFFLARMIGAAHVLSEEDHVVPVTKRDSALQKMERAFAQEFLCPWTALDAFTDERGLDDDALIEAAEHFQVSEWVVRSTLVNRGKISRDRLPEAL